MRNLARLIHVEVTEDVIASVRLAETGAPYHRRAFEVEAVEVDTGRLVEKCVFAHPLFAAMCVFEHTDEMPNLLECERGEPS